MDNLEIWNKLCVTDPKHTKTFKRSGGFEGTAIKPMFSYKRMTEEFGACGIGWGVGKPDFQVVSAGEEILVYCTVSIWHGEKDNVVYGVGGDKVVNKFSSGLKTDDEAFKKAYTDAVTNALKLIGVGADVHMGMFDDSKYVNDMKARFREEQPSDQSNVIVPLSGDEFLALQKEINEAQDQTALNTARDKCTAAKPRMTSQQAKTLGNAIAQAGVRVMDNEKEAAE